MPTAQARDSQQSTRIIAAAAGVSRLSPSWPPHWVFVARREATRAEESYRIAGDAAVSLVSTSRRACARSKECRRLRCVASSRWPRASLSVLSKPRRTTSTSRLSRVLMQREFAVNYVANGDLARALELDRQAWRAPDRSLRRSPTRIL